MFLSRDAFDAPVEEPDRPLLGPSSTAHHGLASGSGVGDGRPGTGSSVAGGMPADEEASTPASGALLRQKMMQQRAAMLKKAGSRSSGLGASMVVANTSMPAAGPSRGSAPSVPESSTGRPSTSSTLASTTFRSEVDDPESLVVPGSPGAAGPYGGVRLGPPDDELGAGGGPTERDMSGLVMPTDVGSSREDEERRRIALQQELEKYGMVDVYNPTAGGGGGGPLAGPAESGPRFDIRSITDPTEMKAFLLNPSPKGGGMIECRIRRDRGGLKQFFPKYILESESGVFLMAAKKQTSNKTSNYVVSMSKDGEPSKSQDTFLGKLRANFLGLEFTAYGTGMNPKKIDSSMPAGHASQLARQELVAVQYSSSLWGSKPRGPRRMNVVIPKVQPNGERLVCRTLDPDKEGLLALSKAGGEEIETSLIETFQNKQPKWNDQIGAYVLNFNKRVTQASVKNFQLISSSDPDTVYLQFGRVGKDCFNMDFRFPISPFQAFAVCLSSFDYKLCCE